MKIRALSPVSLPHCAAILHPMSDTLH